VNKQFHIVSGSVKNLTTLKNSIIFLRHMSSLTREYLSCRGTIRYDTIEEFNVDSKAEYSALSSTRSQKLKKLKQTPVPF